LSEPIRAVDRALDILLCFTKQTPELNLTQISTQVGMHKSTVHRLLATLEQKHFLQRDAASGYYRLGIRLLQMAHLTLEQNDLRRLALPAMRALCEQFRETINLSVLDEPDVVFLEVLESPQRVKLAASPGQRIPAFSTASGKAILSCLPAERVQQVLKQGMQKHTERTILSTSELVDNLALARSNGFAMSLEEYEEGINAVAAPILSQDEQPLAAISVAGPAYRLVSERMLEIGPVLVATARQIAREFELLDPER